MHCYYSMTVWQYDSMTVWQYNSITVWQYDSTTAPPPVEYDSMTVPPGSMLRPPRSGPGSGGRCVQSDSRAVGQLGPGGATLALGPGLPLQLPRTQCWGCCRGVVRGSEGALGGARTPPGRPRHLREDLGHGHRPTEPRRPAQVTRPGRRSLSMCWGRGRHTRQGGRHSEWQWRLVIDVARPQWSELIDVWVLPR